MPESMAKAISRLFKRAFTAEQSVRYFVTLDEGGCAVDLARADAFKGGFEQYVRERAGGFDRKPYVPG